MIKTVLMIVGAMVLFGVSAVWGLVWAIRNHQFKNYSAGALGIFDEEEPPGKVTDAFPRNEE